ncbi:kinase [Apiospora aurea]|uniref:Kinase n=1 Tax=Apiospora aurea TaxID=335848 RepID=A0ABR1PRG2_9PEZI
MPQRHSLTTLTKLWFESGGIGSRDWNAICYKVAEHLLSALAYLSGKSIIHLDVNPDNILYYLEEEERSNDSGGSPRGGFQFQLANFGHATYTYATMITPRRGTIDYYQAPELHLDTSKGVIHHSHKSDIYSLCVTLLAALEGLQTFCSLEGTPNHQDILLLIQKKITRHPFLQDTGKINPDERLSATDLLEKYFNNSRSGEPTAEARKEEVAVAMICDIDMQDTEAPPPPDPPSQELSSMQCIIHSSTRMRHPAERSAACRMPPPAKLTLESGVRKSGRATPKEQAVEHPDAPLREFQGTPTCFTEARRWTLSTRLWSTLRDSKYLSKKAHLE